MFNQLQKINKEGGQAIVAFIVAILIMFSLAYLLLRGYAFMLLLPIVIISISFWLAIIVVKKFLPNAGTATRAVLSILFGLLLAIILVYLLFLSPYDINDRFLGLLS